MTAAFAAKAMFGLDSTIATYAWDAQKGAFVPAGVTVDGVIC